jgi:Phosphotransferase enzyme family
VSRIVAQSGVEPKPPWRDVPAAVRRLAEAALGTPIRRARRVWGGYAPSATFRLFLDDGRTAIFKGTNRSSSDFMRQILGDEERVYRELGPVLGRWAPSLLGSVRHDDWHALLLEDVGPARVPPWSASAARRALRSYAAFHRSTLGRADAELPPWVSRRRHHGFAYAWRELEQDPAAPGHLAELAGAHAPAARRWLEHHLPALRDRAEVLVEAPAPQSLLHFDTRSDNLRLLAGGRLCLFDWPYAAIGPAEFDLAAFVQSIPAEGGPEVERCVAWYAQVAPVRRELLDASVAAVAGFFAARAWQPPIPGLPRLRGIQRRQLKTSLAWAAARLRLPPPTWLDAVAD